MSHPLVELLVGLIPPKDSDPVKLYNWQWKSLVLGTVCLGLGVYAANAIPGLHPAYAMADSVEADRKEYKRDKDDFKSKLSTLTDQVTTILAQEHDAQKRSLTTDLIEATRYKCRSDNAGDNGSRSFWTRRWQDLKLTYRDLTGENWPDVPCSSF